MMDSASSGSMQSSSGGGGGGGDNDEYQSHCSELLSSFLKNHDLSSPKPQQQQPPPPPNFFDLSNILDASFQQNANLHHYLASNHLNLWNLSSSSSSLASSTNQPLNLDSQLHPSNNLNIKASSSGTKRVDGKQDIIAIKNNSKKRSRASRRAPTTVLTTDPINFRQIVQEFTGIPAFDIFSRRANHQMNALSSSYPLRPVPQKGSSSTSSSLLNSRLINARTDFEVVPTENSLPPNLKQPHQTQTENAFNNMQNQFTFQSAQHSTMSPILHDENHGSSSMAAPLADLDERGGMPNHHR